MDSFDWNRLAAAGVISCCVLLGSWAIGNMVILHTTPIKSAFAIADQKDEKIDIKTTNVQSGQEAALKSCGMCHDFNKNGPNKIGPNLYDMMGQNIASKNNFNYSDALKKHHQEKWSIQTMNEWLANPMIFAPSTIMAYPGVSNRQDRTNIIAYLNSISPSNNEKPEASEKKNDSAPKK